MINKPLKINIYSIIGLIIAACFIYYILLEDTALPFSIPAVLHGVHGMVKHWHVIVVGLIPIYIALMIFGTAVVGLYLGTILQRCVTSIMHTRKIH